MEEEKAKTKEELELEEKKLVVEELEIKVKNLKRPPLFRVTFWLSIVPVTIAVVGIYLQHKSSLDELSTTNKKFAHEKKIFEEESKKAAKKADKEKKLAEDNFDNLQANEAYLVALSQSTSKKLKIDTKLSLLESSLIRIYYTPKTKNEASKIDDFLDEGGAKSSVHTSSYNVGKKNQIVYYNDDQAAKCRAVQKLLIEKKRGLFKIRKSSGANQYTSFFKIYVAKLP